MRFLRSVEEINSSSMSTEIRSFSTGTWQTTPNEYLGREIPSGALVIRFRLVKKTGSRRFDTLGGITYDKPGTLVFHGALVIDPSDFLSNKGLNTKLLHDLLSSTLPDVPDYEHPDIIEKIFKMVEGAVFGLVIDIGIVDTTVRLLGCARSVEEYNMNVDRVTTELMELSKHVVATKVSIGGLEKVTLDSLDLAAKQTTCIICREALGDVVRERIDLSLMITRLPCSHMYHGVCIAGWLQMSHLCPFCRYPLPTTRVACELPLLEVKDQGPEVEVKDEKPVVEGNNDQQPILEVAGELQILGMADEGPIVEGTDDQSIVQVAPEQPIFEGADAPPKTSREVDWPMLLKMSACGIVTAMLVCKFTKLLKCS